jgi:predicted phosphodiesterase
VIHDAELYTVAPDEVVVTFRTDDEAAVVTRVGDRAVTTEGRYHAARVTGLEPDTEYELAVEGAEPSDLLPATVTTLRRPKGRLLATIATVNDVHFGEKECGKLGELDLGPVFATAPGEVPYWEVMNAGAIAEIEELAPDAVLAKGDLTSEGSDREYEMFVNAYGRLGDRLHHVRGNHDAMLSHGIAPGHFGVAVDGVTLAVLDTVRPGLERGRIDDGQLEWLDATAESTAGPVLVFGHHQPWNPASREREEHYFGVNPDDSDAFCEVVRRRENVVGFFAGHTHRNRVRRFDAARGIPIVEVACVKDYPGAWAEYRVYEGGYVQIGRRIAAPEAMEWTEKTRHMFAGLYRDYALGSIADRNFAVDF